MYQVYTKFKWLTWQTRHVTTGVPPVTVVYEGGGTSSTEVTTRPPGGTDSLLEPLRGLKGVALAALPLDEVTVPVSVKKEEQRQLKFWKLRRHFRPWFVLSQIPGSVDLNRGWVSSLLGMIGLLAQVAAEADLKWIFFHSVFFFKFSSVLLSSVDRLSSTGHCKVI